MLLRGGASSALAGLRKASPHFLLAVVALLTVAPIVAILLGAFRSKPPGQAGTWTLDGFVRLFNDPVLLGVVWTSVWLVLLRAGLALLLAVVLAWILARTDCPYRNQLESLITLSFFFPSLGKVIAWVLLLSPRTGYLNQLLRHLPFFAGESGPVDIFSYGGIIFTSSATWATILVVFLLPAFRAMDASLEESARMSGASPRRTLASITLPLLRPAVGAALLLCLTRLLSSFETEVFLGTQAGVYVFTNKIYERMEQVLPPDYPTAFTLVLVLMVVTAALVFANWYFRGKNQYTTVTGRSYSVKPVRLGKLRWLVLAFVVLYLLADLVLPALMLVQTSFLKVVGLNYLSPQGYTLANWKAILTLRTPRLALWNSLIMSVWAATAGMLLYSLVAYVSVRTRYRGARYLELASWLPSAVPNLIMGMGVLWTVMFSGLGFLYGTVTILVVAQIVRLFPIGGPLMTSTMIQVSAELEESARVHGASWFTTFVQIMLPLVKHGFVNGWVMAFSLAFGELALVVFLYGPKSTVLPTLFLSLWWGGQLERACVAALIMTAVNLIVVTVVRRLTGKPLTAML